MGKITLSADRYNAAIRNLSRFFEYDKLTEISEGDSAILETSFNINKLHNAYNSYIDSQHLNESIIIPIGKLYILQTSIKKILFSCRFYYIIKDRNVKK